MYRFHIYDSVDKVVSYPRTSEIVQCMLIEGNENTLLRYLSLLQRLLSFQSYGNLNNCIAFLPSRQSKLSYTSINIILTFTISAVHCLVAHFNIRTTIRQSLFFVIENMVHFAMLILTTGKIVQVVVMLIQTIAKEHGNVKCTIVI